MGWCQCPLSIRQLTWVVEEVAAPLRLPLLAVVTKNLDGALEPKLLQEEPLLLALVVQRLVAQFWVRTSQNMVWMQQWTRLAMALSMLGRPSATLPWMRANSSWMQGRQWATSSWTCSECHARKQSETLLLMASLPLKNKLGSSAQHKVACTHLNEYMSTAPIVTNPIFLAWPVSCFFQVFPFLCMCILDASIRRIAFAAVMSRRHCTDEFS